MAFGRTHGAITGPQCRNKVVDVALVFLRLNFRHESWREKWWCTGRHRAITREIRRVPGVTVRRTRSVVTANIAGQG